MNSIRVFNLSTGEERLYDAELGAAGAVAAAYAQANGDYNTWEYTEKYGARVNVGAYSVALGDWCALRAPDDGEPWTVAQAKDLLPDVEIEVHGEIYTASISGRKLPYAEVHYRPIGQPWVHAGQWSWQAIVNALNNHRPLCGD